MLLVNDVYQYGARRFRVLWRDEKNCFWIDIDKKNAFPVQITKENLIKLLQNDDIQYIEDPYEGFLLSPARKKTDWGRGIQDKAWAMIGAYATQEPDVYIREKRGEMVRCIVVAHSTTKQTVYAKLRAYWQRGKSPNALYPYTCNWGNAGQPKHAGDKKRGRPRSTTPGVGVNIDPMVASVFRATLKAYYLNTNGNSLQFAYQKALIALEIDPKNISIEKIAEAPTYEQFYYFVKKEVGSVEKARKRAGEIQYQKEIRPVLGTSAAGVIGPGSLYQIDATIGDIYLLSEHDRKKIIGRPVIYVVIDVFSRLITGIYVGLEGPSWISAMSALANAMMDKVAYCKKFDIDIDHDEWPAVGKPEAILGDKGEMLGHTVEIVSEALNIDIQNTPSFRADWKGVVERQFRTIQEKFKPYVEGYVTGVISKKRAGRDYRLDAELTLSDFTKVIINCVLEYNNTHVVKNYDPDKGMPPELPHNPSALWKWGVQHRTGKLRRANEELVAINLLPHKHASVSEEGITLFGCNYSSVIAIREGWFDRIKAGPRKVLVAYDPHMVNRIYLRPDGKYDSYMTCELTERSREYRDLTFWDVWRIRKIKAETSAAAGHKKIKGRLDLDDKIEKITAEARAKNPDNFQLSKSERTKGIRDNRSHERAREREANKGLMPTSSELKRNEADNVIYLNEKKLQSFDIPEMLDDLYGLDPYE